MNQHWSKLPNAHHIDWVIASLKDNIHLWATAWCATGGAARDAAYNSARDAAYNSAGDAAWTAASETGYQEVRVAAWGAAWGAASDAAWRAASDAARDAAYQAARDVILALIAYDDCDQYLSMSYQELTIWAALSENPAAVLLLPMVYVREKINEPALV